MIPSSAVMVFVRASALSPNDPLKTCLPVLAPPKTLQAGPVDVQQRHLQSCIGCSVYVVGDEG